MYISQTIPEHLLIEDSSKRFVYLTDTRESYLFFVIIFLVTTDAVGRGAGLI